MATIQDVQNAIDAANAAAVAETQAITAFEAVDAVVVGALTAETQTYETAIAVYNGHLAAARDVAGYAAALASRQSAVAAREAADIAARQVMQEFIGL
jgi:uncharacterized protein involved in type VI secretion and phage assembly